jgi:hypothetical protein
MFTSDHGIIEAAIRNLAWIAFWAAIIACSAAFCNEKILTLWSKARLKGIISRLNSEPGLRVIATLNPMTHKACHVLLNFDDELLGIIDIIEDYRIRLKLRELDIHKVHTTIKEIEMILVNPNVGSCTVPSKGSDALAINVSPEWPKWLIIDMSATIVPEERRMLF